MDTNEAITVEQAETLGLISLPDAARVYGVATSTFRRWIEKHGPVEMPRVSRPYGQQGLPPLIYLREDDAQRLADAANSAGYKPRAHHEPEPKPEPATTESPRRRRPVHAARGLLTVCQAIVDIDRADLVKRGVVDRHGKVSLQVLASALGIAQSTINWYLTRKEGARHAFDHAWERFGERPNRCIVFEFARLRADAAEVIARHAPPLAKPVKVERYQGHASNGHALVLGRDGKRLTLSNGHSFDPAAMRGLTAADLSTIVAEVIAATVAAGARR